MKSALLCAVLLVQALLVVSAQQPADFRFQEVTADSKAEQLQQYSSQLEQLRLLQERETATQAALQQQMAALSAQAQAAQAPAPVNPVAAPGVPDAFSFKESMSMETQAKAETAVGSSEQKLKKLATAMTAVKEDIMAKLREAQRESAWVKDVENIVKQYKLKVKNVKKNLKKIRNDIKNLIKKKRQIRNAQIQSQLQDRLEDASGDLKMIKSKLESITSQQKAFEKNRKKIALTITKINTEMKHLKGLSTKPKAKKSEAEAAAEKKPEKAGEPNKAAAKPASKNEKTAGKKDGKKGGKKGKKPSKACKKKCKASKDKKKCHSECAKAEKNKKNKKASFLEAVSDSDEEESAEAEEEESSESEAEEDF